MRFRFSAIPLLALSSLGFSQSYTIQTFAGNGPPANAPGLSVSVSPGTSAVDAVGNVYFVNGHRVMKWTAATGLLSVAAGNGGVGFGGDGGPAADAGLSYPSGLALDAAGNLYIADTSNSRIRKVSGGVITTIVGTGEFGMAGEGGPPSSAQLNQPRGVAVDSAGRLFIADTINQCVREVSNGSIRTIAGRGTGGGFGDNGQATNAILSGPTAVAVDATGNLYIADTGHNRIRKVSSGVISTVAGNGGSGYSGDGGPAAQAGIGDSFGIALDAAGNLYIAGQAHHRIRRVSGGVISTVAGNGSAGYGGDNGPASSAQLNQPASVAIDASGNMYIADSGNFRIRKVSGAAITTVAGNGYAEGDNGPAGSAQLTWPDGVALDAAGNLFIADDRQHCVRKVSEGVITTVAGTRTSGYAGDNGPATLAQLNQPAGVATDAAGNLYIADAGNHRIRKVSNGIITTVAGNGTCGFSGDNGPAASAQLCYPNAVAVGAAGDLYIVDRNNYRVRRVSHNVITTVAGNGSEGYGGDGGPATAAQLENGGIAVDVAGNIYVADGVNNRVRKVSDGIITTIAGDGSYWFGGDGGPAAQAQLAAPSSVAVDAAGNIYVSQRGGAVQYNVDGKVVAEWKVGNRIRKISKGVITTISGNGTWGYGGDGGEATNAELSGPTGISVDSAGRVYIGDTENARIRVLLPYYPLSSGQAASMSPSEGGGSVQVTAPDGIAWTAVSNASWITITSGASGTGPGSFSFALAGNTGAARTGTITVAGQTFTVVQAGYSASPNFAGSIAQFASGAGWETSITLLNLDGVAREARLDFVSDDGGDPWLPVTFPQQSVTETTFGATFVRTLAAGASLILDTTAPAAQTAASGSARLLTNGAIDGFAVFTYTPTGQAAVSPLETRNAPSYLLAFDNTGATSTGLAIANLAPASAADIRVVIRDDGGRQIGNGMVHLPNRGHNSFMLTDSTYGFPVTAGVRGTVEFATPPGGRISVLGLRANAFPDRPGFAVTSLPAMAGVGTGGGVMAQVATGAGWQTTLTLVNTGAEAAAANLNFYDGSGMALALPLSFPQTRAATAASSVNQSIPAGGSLIVVVQDTGAPTSTEGSAVLTTDGNVGAFAVFRYNPTGQEAVAPLETAGAPSYVLAFDNTGNLSTGLAIANVASQPARVNVTLRNDSGALIGAGAIDLPAHGHTSFMLTDASSGGWPATAGMRGTIEFATPPGGRIAPLGLRAAAIPGGFTVTTIPVARP